MNAVDRGLLVREAAGRVLTPTAAGRRELPGLVPGFTWTEQTR